MHPYPCSGDIGLAPIGMPTRVSVQLGCYSTGSNFLSALFTLKDSSCCQASYWRPPAPPLPPSYWQSHPPDSPQQHHRPGPHNSPPIPPEDDRRHLLPAGIAPAASLTVFEAPLLPLASLPRMPGRESCRHRSWALMAAGC